MPSMTLFLPMKILTAYPYYMRRTSHHSPTWTSMSGVSPNYWKTSIHKKPTDPIRFPLRVLKEVVTEISPYLYMIFNTSLLWSLHYTTSDLPIYWLAANISPIYKKGSRLVAASNRPMSLTSVSCKLLEHIIFHHIMGTWINTTSCLITNTGLGLSTSVRPSSVRPSVTFNFPTVTRKRIDVFSQNFAGMCTIPWGVLHGF